MKKILATLVLALGLVLTTMVPASADEPGREIFHDSDSGYDPAMVIECFGFAQNHSLFENWSSKVICKDLGRVYTRPDERYVCFRSGAWRTTWDAPGWHVVNPIFTELHCTLQRDLVSVRTSR